MGCAGDLRRHPFPEEKPGMGEGLGNRRFCHLTKVAPGGRAGRQKGNATPVIPKACVHRPTFGLPAQASFEMRFSFRAIRGLSGEGRSSKRSLLHSTEYYMAIKKNAP